MHGACPSCSAGPSAIQISFDCTIYHEWESVIASCIFTTFNFIFPASVVNFDSIVFRTFVKGFWKRLVNCRRLCLTSISLAFEGAPYHLRFPFYLQGGYSQLFDFEPSSTPLIGDFASLTNLPPSLFLSGFACFNRCERPSYDEKACHAT